MGDGQNTWGGVVELGNTLAIPIKQKWRQSENSAGVTWPLSSVVPGSILILCVTIRVPFFALLHTCIACLQPK
jgi:hypothetical protein